MSGYEDVLADRLLDTTILLNRLQGEYLAERIATTTLEEAWRLAVEHAPQGWFGPRVEPRWPDRWRAWYESPNTHRPFDAWGGTETDALLALVSKREAELDA